MTLRGLIEAVACGAAITSEMLSVLPRHPEVPIHRLFLNIIIDGNDLNSAKRLHDALLPGWWWSIGTCKVSDDARVSPDDDHRAPDGGEWADYTDVDQRPPGNPARAWVISIFRALDERGEGE